MNVIAILQPSQTLWSPETVFNWLVYTIVKNALLIPSLAYCFQID